MFPILCWPWGLSLLVYLGTGHGEIHAGAALVCVLCSIIWLISVKARRS